MIECKACFSTEFRYLEPLGNFYQGQCRHCGKVNRFDREEVEGDDPNAWGDDNFQRTSEEDEDDEIALQRSDDDFCNVYAEYESDPMAGY